MSAPFPSDAAIAALHAVNEELAAQFRCPPAPLTFGADAAGADELVICGILGGKDVGKSTLINALTAARVSADESEVGRGTHRPVVYVHADAVEPVVRRLGGAAGSWPVETAPHELEALRNVALVDMPDFDSEFLEHHAIVRDLVPRLDRVLWVHTPRKIGDHAWAELIRDVFKHADNVYTVLNKVDELLGDEAADGARGGPSNENADRHAARFWEAQQSWLRQSLDSAGCPLDEHHVFLIAAAFATQDALLRRVAHCWDDAAWSRYPQDRPFVEAVATRATADLERLRAAVLAPISRQTGREIKQANRTVELAAGAARIRTHYDLDRTIAQLQWACDDDYRQRLLDDAFPNDTRDTLMESAMSGLRPDATLADELLERRVERWPLLRLVYWPFGWLARAVGRHAGTRIGTPDAHTESLGAADLGRLLSDRIALLRARLLADHGTIARKLAIDGSTPPADRVAAEIRQSLVRLPRRLDEKTVSGLASHTRAPSIFARWGLWFIFLWFPFLQPISAGALQMVAEGGTWHLAQGLYRIVTALSAAHLLAGFAVVAIVYVLILAAMYARCLRAVRAARAPHDALSAVDGALSELLQTQAVDPFLAPFHKRLERLNQLHRRLDEHAA